MGVFIFMASSVFLSSFLLWILLYDVLKLVPDDIYSVRYLCLYFLRLLRWSCYLFFHGSGSYDIFKVGARCSRSASHKLASPLPSIVAGNVGFGSCCNFDSVFEAVLNTRDCGNEKKKRIPPRCQHTFARTASKPRSVLLLAVVILLAVGGAPKHEPREKRRI